MSNQNEASRLIVEIQRNYPDWSISTFGPCCNDGCGCTARGSGRCPFCLESELAKIVGSEKANEFHKIILERRRVVAAIMEASKTSNPKDSNE